MHARGSTQPNVFFIGCHQSWRSSVSEEHRFLWDLGGLMYFTPALNKKDTHTKSELKLLCSYMCINLGKTCINNLSMNHLCAKRGNKLFKLPCDNTSMFISSHFPLTNISSVNQHLQGSCKSFTWVIEESQSYAKITWFLPSKWQYPAKQTV